MLKHENEINEAFIDKFGSSVSELFSKWNDAQTTVDNIDEDLTSKFFGFEDKEDYYRKASCVHRIP